MCTSKPKQVLLLAICLMIMAGVQATPVEFSHTTNGVTTDYILDNPVTDSANSIGFKATFNYTTWVNGEGATLICVPSDNTYAFTDGDTGFLIQHNCATGLGCTRDDVVEGNIDIVMRDGTMTTSSSDRVWTSGSIQT